MSRTSQRAAALGSQLQFTIDAHRKSIRNTTTESSRSLHVAISEQSISQNLASDLLVGDLTYFDAFHEQHTLETQSQAGALRAHGAVESRYSLEEYHLQTDRRSTNRSSKRSSKQTKATLTKRQMSLAQEELLRGIHLSDTDDVQLLWGRDGYNTSLDVDIVEDGLDITLFRDEVGMHTSPLDRFLGSRGPWTPMDIGLNRSANPRHYVLTKSKK
ncbi:hypothetical protein AOQ84DRAFT_222893 [Glonium stellatum]|uniref:Uncharacterized protein n=1 Tax=Glonium stellatum TaxID=574774 RepID=A0A8E2EZ38_9PEZI|nr:hypothetical protein AOQ84DRAFT_222893 [Glonium stellatum]